MCMDLGHMDLVLMDLILKGVDFLRTLISLKSGDHIHKWISYESQYGADMS